MSSSSLFDSTVAPLRLAANYSIVWPNRPCRQTRPRLQPWSNHNLLRLVASSKYPHCLLMVGHLVYPN